MIATHRFTTAVYTARKLWRDDRASLLTIELILLATVMGIGTIVGLTTFRDAVSQEFGDAAAGMASIDHGYDYIGLANSGVIDNMRFDYAVSGSQYVDERNFCEPATLDPANDAPMCLQFSADFTIDEGEALR